VTRMGRLESELVVIYPMMSEDTVKLIETENKITFIVNDKASKHDVKRAIEELYEVKVSRVFTLTTPEGRKKAYVKLSPESKASELAVKLGIL
jgi:large subunit ribosomal protein L23